MLPLSAPADRRGESSATVARLVRVLAAGQLALVAVTWKLWTPQTVFPQVPLIRVACHWPGWLDWICLVVLVASSVVLLVVARRGWISRVATCTTAGSFSLFFVLDQHRLQPWAWQFLLLNILLSLADDATVRRGWIGLTVSIYFWSAVSKIDYNFFTVEGPALLGGLKQAIGLKGVSTSWTEALDIAGAVGLTVGELGVAMLLTWPRGRRYGLWAATLMHLALLAALGPLGLNHSWGVLLWNVFFIVQDWTVFGVWRRRVTGSDGASRFALPTQWRSRGGLAIIVGAMLWPALEPFGWCDHWLAWAVYSARSDRAQVIEGNPWATAHREWTVVPISQLSIDRLGVPVYPQHRFQVGVAMSLFEDSQAFAIGLWRPKSRWPERRNPNGGLKPISVEFVSGQAELSAKADGYFLNARPR